MPIIEKHYIYWYIIVKIKCSNEKIEKAEKNLKIEFICEVINRSKAMQVSMLMIKLINGCILYNCHRINKLCEKIS